MAAPDPLSAAQLEAFGRDGFVTVTDAFPRDVALRCRDALWAKLDRDHGILREDAATWSKAPKGRVGLAESFGGDDLGAPWAACWSPKLRSAIDQLCGAGRWVEPGLGWWVLSFPSLGPMVNWGAEGTWHVDGSHYTHTLDSPEIGLLPIFLFSDVQKEGGGTALAPGSHRAVARLLARAGDEGINGPRLSALARAAVGEVHNPVETIGRAGDVLLAHPLLLHARSANLGNAGDAGAVRFMCHPAVVLRAPARLAGSLMTPVEAALRAALELPAAPLPAAARRRPRDPDDDATLLAMGFSGFGKRRKGRA